MQREPDAGAGFTSLLRGFAGILCAVAPAPLSEGALGSFLGTDVALI